MEQTEGADKARIEREMQLVNRIADAVQRDLKLSDDIVEFADLVQFGWVGLQTAKERFDPSRGTDFRWFAQRRIRGAIIDGLRAMTRLPRRAHQLLRLAAIPQDDDIRFGDSLGAALDVGRLFARSGFLLLHSPFPHEPAPHVPSPEDLAHDKRLAERVRSIVDELDEPDREIARRRIFDGQAVAAIAADLGYSRPWAWRVFERACRHILLEMSPRT
jgi:RNA polymerase sigma factor (sigma-70 family)